MRFHEYNEAGELVGETWPRESLARNAVTDRIENPESLQCFVAAQERSHQTSFMVNGSAFLCMVVVFLGKINVRMTQTYSKLRFGWKMWAGLPPQMFIPEVVHDWILTENYYAS